MSKNELEMQSMKRFTEYVAENKPEYKYTLKFAVPDMTDAMIDTVESALRKYEFVSASAFRKSPILENPLDFPNIKNMPVFITNISIKYPASLDFLRVYLGNNLGLSTQQIVVYSENDPRQIETDLFLTRSSPEYKDSYVAILDPANPAYGGDASVAAKDSTLYGKDYNLNFLKELSKVQKEQEQEKTVINNALSVLHTTDPLPDGYEDFNSDKNLPKDDVGLFGRIKLPTTIKVGTL